MHTVIKVKVRYFLSKTVQVTTGLRQGDAMSPILVNLALEKVVKDATIDIDGVRLGEKNIGILAYANDVLLLVEIKDQLKQQSENL